MSQSPTFRGTAAAASIVSAAGSIFALIEALYILMLELHANHENTFFRWIKSLAEPLALFFPGLFAFGNVHLDTIVNYGLAAVFWLVLTGFIARVVSHI